MIDIRVLSCMNSKMLRDIIRNKWIYNMLELASIKDEMREIRLRWFGHLGCIYYAGIPMEIQIPAKDFHTWYKHSSHS